MNIIRIGIFASGNGSNAEQIINHFKDNKLVEVGLILSNNSKAYVLERAKNHEIPFLTFSRDQFNNSEYVVNHLKENKIDFIVLAGFLWLIPTNLIDAYPKHIVNIHPALLPKYGGKGMYGDNVHRAVKNAGESESGITIHWVNEKYDEGQIIFQAKCELNEADTPDSIAAKVHTLEYKYYPPVIEDVLKDLY